MSFQQQCSTPGCEKAASLQCPICQKLELEASFFCDQDCFKSFFPIHKFMHKKKEIVTDTFKYSGPLRPGKVTPRVQTPEDIPRPDWAYTGFPKEEQESKYQKNIIQYNKEEIESIRKVCLLARQALDLSHTMIAPGVTTEEINQAVHKFHIDNKAYPSPLNYHKFPKSCCTSVNEVICHGIPDDRPLQAGDICNVDISTFKYGMHSDLNETFAVGEIPESSKFLIEKTYRSLELAISMVKPGVMYRDIGNAIGKYIEEQGLQVVRTYTGHGVGKQFHCAPNIPHYKGNKATGFMKEGHVFTIEPMINQGTSKDILWNDDWTAATADGQRSAQFEHTILVTESGCEVLTKRLESSPKLCFQI